MLITNQIEMRLQLNDYRIRSFQIVLCPNQRFVCMSLLSTTAVLLTLLYSIHCIIVYYSHFIGHLLSRYRRISDCLYSIVYGQAGRYAPYRPAYSGPLCTITARIARYNVAYLPLEPSGYAT